MCRRVTSGFGSLPCPKDLSASGKNYCVRAEIGSSALQKGIEAGLLCLHSVESGKIGGHEKTMPDTQRDNHDSHQAGRNTGDSPKDVYSGLKYREELAVGNERVCDSDGGVPELHDSYCHVEAEEVEGTLVAVPDAGLCPHAVMVQLVNAPTATAAMRHSRPLPVVALIASL